MTIKVRIEAHAYAEDELRDEYFDDRPIYGIAGPTTMAPLDNVRNQVFEYEYDKHTSLGEFRAIIEESIWCSSSTEEIYNAQFYFVINNRRYSIGTPTANFAEILDKYIDPERLGMITICFLVSYNAGEVGPQNGPLRYFFHSHERGRHHLPHVHVHDVGHNYEASVRLIDGEIEEGYLPSKLSKLAKEEIMANQKQYYQWWNMKTDGLLVDLQNPF